MGDSSRFVAQTLSNPIAIKMDENNFLPWKQQALFTIEGRKLQKHISKNGGKPKMYLNEEDERRGKISDE